MKDQPTKATLPPRTALLRRLMPEPFTGKARLNVGRQIGQGGMGTVFEAVDMVARRVVAMKVTDERDGNADLARFVAEARITANLEHPNIVPVHELGVDKDERVYYTMKYVRGETLEEALRSIERGETASLSKYTLARLLTVFQKTCDAIAFAHSHNVIHRDLKPANIMIGDFGEVLVMDWGLAKCLPGASNGFEARALSSPDLTLDGEMFGTPHFMAPEQARGLNSLIDEKTDIYALGAILHCILTLHRPISGDTPEQILENVRRGQASNQSGARRPLPHLPDGTPPAALLAVARQAMATDATQRYRSVVHLQDEISAFQGGFATRAESAGFLKLIALALRRHRRETHVAMVAVLMLCTVIGLAFYHLRVERDRANNSLEELRKAAPLFSSQARVFASQERIEQALEKLTYALTLRPKDVNDLIFKAELLQAQLRLPEAISNYVAALQLSPTNVLTRSQIRLCEELISNSAGNALSREELTRLLLALAKDRRPTYQLMPAFTALGITPDIARRVVYDARGRLSLDLSRSEFHRLPSLAGMPLSFLNLSRCINLTNISELQFVPLTELKLYNTAVSDLSALQGLPLESLDLRLSPITNITPLLRMPLRELLLFRTKVTDFAALKSLRDLELLDLGECSIGSLSQVAVTNLQLLRIGHTGIQDLSFLAGSKLQVIHFDSVNVRDISPLLKCPELRWIVLPRAATNVTLLKSLPNLERISFSWTNDSMPSETAIEFWKRYSKR